jgi:4-carboxymuconolactone decarboxylase
MSDSPTFGRYAEIPYDEMTPEQQEGYRFMIESRGGLPGPSKIWIHNPKLAKIAGPLGAHFHAGRYSLTEREREIAVCIITGGWHSVYPTNAHERRAKEVELPAENVDAIIAGLQTSFDDEREQVVYEMPMVLSNARWVPKDLFDRAVKAPPGRHHRHDHADGSLHQRGNDPVLLRRARRCGGYGTLTDACEAGTVPGTPSR